MTPVAPKMMSRPWTGSQMLFLAPAGISRCVTCGHPLTFPCAHCRAVFEAALRSIRGVPVCPICLLREVKDIQTPVPVAPMFEVCLWAKRQAAVLS